MISIKKYILLLITVVWISFIFYMSTKPGDESAKTSLKIVDVIVKELRLSEAQADTTHFIVRKAGHFTEYFILSLLITLTYSEFYNKKLNLSFILLVCILAATCDEYLQSFINGRSSQVRDVLIDFSGGLTQLLIFIFMKARSTKIHRRNKYIG
ncbi:VanZ family protein [Clostridium punense]|uniref:VanZ family protein n=1 Tax=Clostridium punense TaxID=1054297 RepID=A0ABS4K022_9CLOT|nr:VanZ family protein [Clostridium punense]